jgi:putative ABC transport system ATP-binding protein
MSTERTQGGAPGAVPSGGVKHCERSGRRSASGAVRAASEKRERPVSTELALPTSAVIELREAWREYTGGVAALRGVSLRVDAGELMAVVGPSGSGKSTLLHLMGTLDRPSRGVVRIAGTDVAELTDRQLSAVRARRIGFVFQRFHLPAGVPALDAVADGLLYAGGVSLRRRRARAEETLIGLGLGHRLRHRPHELSGGERQRVAIARAIVGAPSVILADEPTGNLDTRSGEEVMRVLTELNRAGTAVVVVTHNRELAERLTRRVELVDGLVTVDSREPRGRRDGREARASRGGAV